MKCECYRVIYCTLCLVRRNGCAGVGEYGRVVAWHSCRRCWPVVTIANILASNRIATTNFVVRCSPTAPCSRRAPDWPVNWLALLRTNGPVKATVKCEDHRTIVVYCCAY